MKDRVKSYTSPGIVVKFEPRRCIHAAECVFGLPLAFDPERRPWIDANASDPDSLARVIERCPTGALHYERLDGGTAEEPDAINRVRVTHHGPLHLRGRIEIRAEDGSVIASEVRVALCRCGASHNKPFCDNSHRLIRFVDPGNVFDGALQRGDAAGDPTLRITVQEGGPYRAEGPLEIESADGRVRLAGKAAKLCRCGASRNKPFCDGSHRTDGFAED